VEPERHRTDTAAVRAALRADEVRQGVARLKVDVLTVIVPAILAQVAAITALVKLL
jgi:hypothetical protein